MVVEKLYNGKLHNFCSSLDGKITLKSYYLSGAIRQAMLDRLRDQLFYKNFA